MVRRSMGVLVAVAALCVSAAGAAEAQMDPTLGTWIMNVERSVWTPGPRAPADAYQLRQYVALEDGWYLFVLTGRNAAGNPTVNVGVYRLDGQQHPVHGNAGTLARLMIDGEPSNLTRSYRVIDENTVEFTTYADGVPGDPVIRQMLADGNTFIQVSEGTNPAGVEFRNVLVFDRVN